ncbi:efflux RND transporter periplasmic adaptor subunit [Marivirga lumbricoides]|uniref:Efflux RND transporter periplasmic adaptor subunit n=1 Tax=Marivirga lumbricoides TaxID=1046115 RepID=A0A2T4DKG3_9BACT|nr:efflux RND transporter periplasmic adaptor subunit [Marivirga lumbricoides]
MKTTNLLKSFASVGFVLLMAACSSSESKSKPDMPIDKIPVKIWPITKTEGAAPLHGSGQFATEDETMLSFKTGGIINKIWVNEGDLVQKGQVLATLDLTEINTSVAQAQLGYEKALRDYERLQRLLADSVATLEQFQNSKTALELAEQNLKAVNFNKEHSVIRSPFEGYVLLKLANTGQQISSGTPVLLVNGVSANNWKLKVALTDKEWAFISENDSAYIQTSVEPDKIYQAKVSSKGRQADPKTGAYIVELSFQNKVPEYLAAGMFGSANIFSQQNKKTWNIPYEALLDANGGYGFVFVTENKQQAKKVTVKVGEIYPDEVQILEGLDDYSHLIISGSAYLTDQSSILIQN